jgi:hypothetical protein
VTLAFGWCPGDTSPIHTRPSFDRAISLTRNSSNTDVLAAAAANVLSCSLRDVRPDRDYRSREGLRSPPPGRHTPSPSVAPWVMLYLCGAGF